MLSDGRDSTAPHRWLELGDVLRPQSSPEHPTVTPWGQTPCDPGVNQVLSDGHDSTAPYRWLGQGPVPNPPNQP